MVFIAALALVSTTSLASVDQDYVQRLTRARTAAQVTALKSTFHELKIARTACRLQVREKSVPLACYEALAAEIRWGLHPKRADQVRLRSQLDDLCREAAALLEIPRTKTDLHHLSASCRAEVVKARRIQDYRESPRWSE